MQQPQQRNQQLPLRRQSHAPITSNFPESNQLQLTTPSPLNGYRRYSVQTAGQFGGPLQPPRQYWQQPAYNLPLRTGEMQADNGHWSQFFPENETQPQQMQHTQQLQHSPVQVQGISPPAHSMQSPVQPGQPLMHPSPTTPGLLQAHNYYRDHAPSPSSRSSSSSDVGSEHSEYSEQWFYNSPNLQSPADSFVLESHPPSTTSHKGPFSFGPSSHSSSSSSLAPLNMQRSGSTASLQAVHEDSLLDDLDPTPRPNYSQNAQQRTPYLPHHHTREAIPPQYNGHTPNHSYARTHFISPAPSATSLPELSHRSSPPEDAFWTDLSHFNLENPHNYRPSGQYYGEHPPAQPALTMSDPTGIERRLGFSASSDDLNGGRLAKRRSTAPVVVADPLHWQSQTTTATKQAAIARRKPGAAADFICPYCRESFTRRYNLKGHMRAHNGERPFVCDHLNCGKAFARAHDLKRHKELHNSASRYKCDTCDKRFKRIDALQRHYKAEQDLADADGRPDQHCYDPAGTLEASMAQNWPSAPWPADALNSPYSEDGLELPPFDQRGDISN